MARGACSFGKRRVEAAIKAAFAAGAKSARVEFENDKMVLIANKSAEAEPQTDFDRWKARHADQA